MTDISAPNRALVDRAVGLLSVTTVSDGLAITSWSMLEDIMEAVRADERAITIERCAVAAEAQDREGREWVRHSLWAEILKRAGQNVRALARADNADALPPSPSSITEGEAKRAALREGLRLAKDHLSHMSAWIGARQASYSFEALGEDMSAIDAAYALVALPSTGRECGKAGAAPPAQPYGPTDEGEDLPYV